MTSIFQYHAHTLTYTHTHTHIHSLTLTHILLRGIIMSEYGFVKIERDVAKAVPNPKPPTPQLNTDLPNSKVSQYILEYAQEKLPTKVLNHSLRVYLYSRAIIKDQFPDWNLDDEVVFVTSLLHDIGTTDQNMKATKMSFEFYGGLLSRDLVLNQTKNQDYAEAVSEAIIRHQDLEKAATLLPWGLYYKLLPLWTTSVQIPT